MTQAEILGYLDELQDNDVNLPALEEHIRRGVGVVPFVGAGMSAPFHYPQWDEFLRDLAKRAGLSKEIEARLAAGQYDEAAEDLIAKLTGRFQELVEHHFGDHVLRTAKLTGNVTVLPRLAIGPMITTNFDSVLEHVFQEAGRPFDRVVWHEKVNLAIRAFNTNDRVLLKIHGTWDDPGHRVLTGSEYREHYGDPDGDIDYTFPLPQLFRLLVMRPLLFLGCSLRQDRTVKIIAKIAAQYSSFRHFAVLELPKPDMLQQRADQLAEWNVRPIWYPPGKHERIEKLLQYLAEQIPEGLRPVTAKATARRDTIPPSKDVFIGRVPELKDLRDLIARHFLVTVSGPPGAGKTRLAAEVARSLREDFDAVWFVPLPMHGTAVDQRVANALQIAGEGQRPLRELIIEFLRLGRQVVVLDNCEPVLEEARALVNSLLTACPDLRIVATSRAVLRDDREHVYHIPPLELPDPDHLPDLKSLALIDSIELLLARVEARMNFRLTDANARAVAELGRRLEGIPLAIELAAAQLRVMSVDEILERYSQRLDLWKDDRTPSDERKHATLRESIQMSVDLIGRDSANGERMQAFFRRLSVFHHGCTWASATSVCGEPGQTEGEVLDMLKALLDASLLQLDEAAAERRFRYLDSIREFAAGELAKAGETEVYAEKHAQWFTELTEKAAPQLLKEKQAYWLQRITAEADNVRAAIFWAVEHNRAEVALRLTGSLWRVMDIKGFYPEGCARLRMALDMPGSAQFPLLRSKVLSGVSILAYRQGDLDTAEKCSLESLEIERRWNNPPGIANALNDLGNVAQLRGDFEAAHRLYSESLEIERATANKRGVAVALFNTGTQARRLGKWDEAREKLEESFEAFESEGNMREAAFPLNGLGLVARRQGRYDAALQFGERSLAIRRELEDRRGMAESLRTLAAARVDRGEMAGAFDLLRQSAELAVASADKRGIAETLELFAALATAEGNFVQAASLYATAEQTRKKIHLPLDPTDLTDRERNLQKGKLALTASEYETAWEAGRWMPAQEALQKLERSKPSAAGE